MKIAIATDSNSGIFEAEGKKLGIFVLPMPILIDNKVYFEGQNLSSAQFYQYLQDGKNATTSQPSPGDLTMLWEQILDEGYDALVYIPMSSGLSSSCAMAKMLAEDYNGKVFVVDNHRISVTQRYSVLDALSLVRAGCTGQDVPGRKFRRSWSVLDWNPLSMWAWKLCNTSSAADGSLQQQRPWVPLWESSHFSSLKGISWMPAPRCEERLTAKNACSNIWNKLRRNMSDKGSRFKQRPLEVS